MGDISELFNGSIAPGEPSLIEARLYDSAEAVGEEVRCTIPSIDPNTATDPMPWEPVVTELGTFYPKVGDRALLAFPEEGPPVIVWWEPKAEHPDHAASAGVEGPAGPEGPKGSTGSTGPAGATGPTGATGSTGAKGERGEKGETGSAGPPGEETVESTVENLKVIRGIVNTTTPTIVKGSGFTVTKNSTGTVTITFSAEFTDVPSVSLGVASGSFGRGGSISEATKAKAKLVVFQVSNQTEIDGEFHFIAIGPR